MGYDWDDKRDVCYRLYVEEKRSLEEVVEYFRDKLQFVPSKRTFQTQFKRWGFPTKIDYSHKDEAVVQRVREMWHQNFMQKEMLATLQAEGYNVSPSGLMRLRFKHGLHLKGTNHSSPAPLDDSTEAGDGQAAALEGAESQPHGVDASIPLASDQSPAHIEELASAGEKRKAREEALRIANDEKWKSKKRRRHTKQWGGLPPDPPGPPRYPSETTIGEAQKFLGLDDDMYRDVRDQFRDICVQRDIVKKTICGPQRWDEAKKTLLQVNSYLQQLFITSEPSLLQPLQLSLDVICMDVTKHIRTQSAAMTLAEAKNALGMNPLEARELKGKLIDLLVANDFVNTYESDNWNGLKDEWVQTTSLRDRVPQEEGPERDRFLKAIQLICRDTLKRWRESQRRSSSGKGTPRARPAPRPAAATVEMDDGDGPVQERPQPKPAKRARQATSLLAELAAEDVQIDPSLLQAANTSSTALPPEEDVTAFYPAPTATDTPAEPPLPVFFRRSPLTATVSAPPVWLGALSSRTVSGLHECALSFVGGQDYTITQIDGISPGPSGGELSYQIDHDDELQGYLMHSEGRKATFVVQLAPR